MSGKKCECCGQPLPKIAGLWFDGWHFEYKGRRGRLTPLEGAFFTAVLDAHPRQAPVDYLCERMWPFEREPEDWMGGIRVVAHRVRKKIGLPIVGTYGVGYAVTDSMPKFTRKAA